MTKTMRNTTVHTYSYDILGRIIEDAASTKPNLSGIYHMDIANAAFDEGTTSWDLAATGSGSTPTASGAMTLHGDSSGGESSASQSIQLNGYAYYALVFTAGGAGTLTIKVDGNTVATISPGDYVDHLTEPFYVDYTGQHDISLIASDDSVTIDDLILAGDWGVEDRGFENYGSDWTMDPYMAGIAIDGDNFTFPAGHSSERAAYLGSDGILWSFGDQPYVHQSVYFTPGTYVLSFANAKASVYSSQSIDVLVGGTSVGGTEPGDDWASYTVRFTIATTGYYEVGFGVTNTDPWEGENIVLVDDVGLYKQRPGMMLGTVVASQRITTTYNSLGLVDTVTSYDAASMGGVVNQVMREYNGFGQVTKEYQAHGVTVNTSTTLNVGYSYDTAAHGSRLTGVTYPDNSSMSYSYGGTSSLNYMISRLDAMIQGAVTLESYKYLGLSTVVERAHPQGTLTLSYIGSPADAGDQYAGLDRFGRVVRQKWTNAGGSVDEYTYDFDANSNVTEKVNVNHTANNETYTYDGLNRLTASNRYDGNASDQSFALDALGNLTGVTTNGTPENRTSNSQNQLTVVGSNSLYYDDNGNMTIDDKGQTLVWDAWNRLVAVVGANNFLIKSYTYDAMGRRTSETDGYSVTDFYYSTSWQVLEERIGGVNAVNNIWSPVYVNALILRDRDTDANGSLDQRIYAMQDANFNVTTLASSTGGTLEHFAYLAGGIHAVTDNTWTVQGSDTLEWKVTYQGGQEDLVTGNINFQRRDYNPRLLTWNSADPIQDGMNWYAFGANNAINRTDPSGLVWTIHRDHKKLAIAEPGEHDTIRTLAEQLHLNPSEYHKWLTAIVPESYGPEPDDNIHANLDDEVENKCKYHTFLSP